jgi:hypothetical protein
MNEKLDQYREKFGEQFPLMLVRGFDEGRIIKMIDQCIRDGTPYTPKLDPKADY